MQLKLKINEKKRRKYKQVSARNLGKVLGKD